MAQNLSNSIKIDQVQNTTIDDDDWSTETLDKARFIVQRIIVPCIVTIGIAGNLLTVVVLTRRRMRCSTNIYLTALAIADIVFLFFVFILSLQRYPNYKYGHGLYWSSFGLSNWFHDATLYSSVYLTVSFTLERYISVCHPLRGQVLCTESRAKKVITAVFLLCFLCTITTRFEFELKVDQKRFDYSIGQPCERNDSLCNPVPWYRIEHSNLSLATKYHHLFRYPSAFFGVLLPFVLLAILNGYLIWTVRKSQKMRHNMTNTRQADRKQENKVTITLIAVVILFLVCQTPNTLQMLNIMHQSQHKNKQLVMNNIYNLLLAVNAASNFILYCVLSDKYRKTVKALFCGTRPIGRRNTLSSSRYTSARTTSSFYSRSQNSGIFNMTFRRKRGPRFSITKEEYANLQAETAKKGRFSLSITSPNSRNNSVLDVEQNEAIPLKERNTRAPEPERNRIRFSFTPSINTKSLPKNSRESILKIDAEKSSPVEITEICEYPAQAELSKSSQANVHRNNDGCQVQEANKSFLQPSPSETSLTRSRSLNFPPLPKHSPDCKDNPYKF